MSATFLIRIDAPTWDWAGMEIADNRAIKSKPGNIDRLQYMDFTW